MAKKPELKATGDSVVQVNFRLRRSMKEAGEESAEAGHRNFSQLITMLLEAHLVKEGRWPPKKG